MKATFFEEPVDHYSCVERAWRARLETDIEPAIFLRSRPGQWTGNSGSWSIKYLLQGRASFETGGQWCDVHEGFAFVVPEHCAYRSILHGGLSLSIFGRELAEAAPEPELAVGGVFELTKEERDGLEDSLAALEHLHRRNNVTVPDQGMKIEIDQPFPTPRSWRRTCAAVRQWQAKGPARSRSARRLLAARHFLTAHFREKDICIQAAGLASMTRSHFSREFSRLFGKSPRRYVVEYRTAVARQLLASGRYSVEQVATQLGYRHASSLNHLFQRNAIGNPQSLRA